MNAKNFQNTTNWYIIRASIIAKQRLLRCADEYNLSIMQALTLCLLEPGKSVPMSELSDLLACDRSNVTGIIERLFVGKYLLRHESSSDRRVKIVELTDAGTKLRTLLLSTITDEGAPNLNNLEPDELATLNKLLRKTLPEAHTHSA